MKFYSSIAKNYDYIFPIQPAQVKWVAQFLQDDFNWLDIGCATGKLPVALASHTKNVVGIDLDEELLSIAHDRNEADNIVFQQGNMLKLKEDFKSNEFDVITCLGNTLVHLNTVEELQKFFSDSYDLLNEGGKLLVQVINYDRILDKKIDGLPTVNNEHVEFIRNYHYSEAKHLIDFETKLTIKETSEVIDNSVWLYPLRRKEVEQMVKESGFSKIDFFGSFKEDELSSETIPMIFVCRK
ncbi:class I SAM-dependent methyltransferase [Prolixibacteraceae bacterium JC049]|nr:class I SAM-dependent methyltransferase [Prolixibacteraceae bacterium JC049]